MPQTRSEVSVYRTVHDIQGYRYLKTLIFDLYSHYGLTNAGLPLFIPGYYVGKITDSIVGDILENNDSDATRYFELLTRLGREDVLERADAGQDLDFESFLEQEMDWVVSEQMQEVKEQFVQDMLFILEDERICCFDTRDEDPDVLEGLQLAAYGGELAQFDPHGAAALNPYKGGGFSCMN